MFTRRRLLGSALLLPVVNSSLGRAALAQGAVAPAGAIETDAAAEAQLREDASAAWSFFARPSDALPGMVPANIWPEDGGFESYDIATMWDTGSIILALVAARSIGLVDDAAFNSRVDGIRTFLERATYSFRGWKLANYGSQIKDGRSVEAGYDATDTGRLFVALHVLERATKGKFDGQAVMRRWDIGKTITDSGMQDIKNGKITPAESYIYRYYIARAAELWSLNRTPVYSGPSPDTDAAAYNAFVDELKKIGPISSEPSLTEVVELGHSPFTRAIAKELGGAQLQRFQMTGKLTCVSEAPIDKEPWFTYQGYDLAREGREDAWTVYAYTKGTQWNTESFAATYRMINTKGAFLWYATDPQEYTKSLWQAVRLKARSEKFGYHAGIYEASGKTPSNIDLNTNAVVLEAVAYILNGRKPLSDIEFSTQ